MKTCKNCGENFTPTHETRGHEQLYCSKKCSQIAAKKRRDEKMINEIKNKIENERESNEEKNTERNYEIRSMASREVGGASPNGRIFTNEHLAILEKLYDSKIENNYLKLQIEKLTDELKSKNEEIFELEMELESSEEEDEQGSMLGSIFTQFKKDPTNTITFVKSMIDEYTKPKQNA